MLTAQECRYLAIVLFFISVITGVTWIRRTTDGHYETKAHVYASYERFCSYKNVGKESSEAFSRRLKKLAFEEPKQQRTKESGKAWVWPNIRLIDYTKTDEHQEVLDI
jgi:hypothetical protein